MLVFETEKLTQRKVAIIAGLSIIVMAICAGFSYGFVHSSLIVKGDATATLSNISGSIGLFRAEILGWLIVLLLDILVSWELYVFLKQIDNSLALLAAWLRLSYTAILGIAITHLICITVLLNGDDYLMSIPLDQLKVQLMYHINVFDKIWSFGLVIFGFHLLILGYAILKSDFIPKKIGILLLIASLCYVLIHSLHLFLPQIENITLALESILSLPMAVGELVLGLWLLIKGGRITKIKN